MQRQLLSLCAIGLCGSTAWAQGNLVDSRDQAEGWYLPVICNVTANGGKTAAVTVAVYKDNTLVTELPPDPKKSTCELELDINSQYTIIINKVGYRQKTVYIDASLPDQQVKYKQYVCNVDLEPLDKFAHSDPFFLDFPSSIVRWSNDQQAFLHNDQYLADIQLKMALLGAQLDTQ
jgi:hypothetical protein